MKKPLASVILSTYNAPRHLELALTGMRLQTEMDFELHIADDGSTSETSDVVERFMESAPFPVIYSWQQDLGFRKTKILNATIRKAKADYFIFIDGDCIPHKDYVRNHLRYRQKGYYLAGRRVDLGREFSATLTPDSILRGDLNRLNFSLLLSTLRKDSSYWHRSLPIYGALLRNILNMNKIDDMKGCNFSVDRESLFKINGFDEDYEGYNREDTDLELRMQYLGLKIKSLKGLAIQYHIWHERLPETPRNDDLIQKLVRTRDPVCRNGLVRLSADEFASQ